MHLVRISNISYLNTLPFRYGLRNFEFPNEYDVRITEDFPSECARKLAAGECEIGIVPVAATILLNDHSIVSDYCIASRKEVKSVMLFSEKPVEMINGIFLDYQSRTSVKLIKYLAANAWKKDFIWYESKPGYENEIKDNTAGLVIGDRALQMYDKFPFRYDLATEWNKITGLPFVFAVWVANKSVPAEFLNQFSLALEHGVNNKEKAIQEIKDQYTYDIKDYLTNNIHYYLDDDCRKAMKFFLNTAF